MQNGICSPEPRLGGASSQPESLVPLEKDDSEYMLRWNEHNSQLINVFHQLCQDNQFTDVTLATEESSFQAHKLILSACSPYFKKLFTQNPCKHPIIFLKDIPESHMKLLLEYMYRGSISVKQHELQEILRTASCLKIRGLTTAEAPPSDISDTPRPLIVDERYVPSDSGPDKFQHLETASSKSGDSGRSGSTSRKAEGRKNSAPKKLRLSGDRDSDISSPRYPISLQEVENRISPVEDRMERMSSSVSPSDDNIAVSEEEDEPVDFSTKYDASLPKSQFSILGSYLKAGRPGVPEDDYDSLRRSELSNLAAAWMNPLAALQQQQRRPRPASRDSRGDSREEREEREEMEEERREEKVSLTDSMGIPDMDMAAKMRSQFLANLPTLANPSSFGWLNAMQQGKRSRGAGESAVVDIEKLKADMKFEKHPLGGIKTGEIGANGKPAVACEVCGKKLADPSSLYRHRKIHSGDKPHKCPYCPRRFIQRYNMKQHIKTHRIELLADGKKGIDVDVDSDHEESVPMPLSLKNLPSFLEHQERGLNMTQ